MLLARPGQAKNVQRRGHKRAQRSAVTGRVGIIGADRVTGYQRPRIALRCPGAGGARGCDPAVEQFADGEYDETLDLANLPLRPYRYRWVRLRRRHVYG